MTSAAPADVRVEVRVEVRPRWHFRLPTVVGLDRLTALSLGLDNIRDMLAFPKTTSATDLMCEAPSEVGPEQLSEVHIRTAVPPPPKPA